jgi:hypothetical protein
VAGAGHKRRFLFARYQSSINVPTSRMMPRAAHVHMINESLTNWWG